MKLQKPFLGKNRPRGRYVFEQIKDIPFGWQKETGDRFPRHERHQKNINAADAGGSNIFSHQAYFSCNN